MTDQDEYIAHLLDRVSGLDQKAGDPRLKLIVRKLVNNLFDTIEEFDISDEEFWQALNLVAQAAPEFGLFAPGMGIERYLDIRADRAAIKAGIAEGTPRTIEGPLYVAGAPLSDAFARLDDGNETGLPLYMHGKVLDIAGKPLAGAVVDVWHANTQGNYSHFGPSQPAFNFRRRIKTDAYGGYSFQSLLPVGYSVPPGSVIERLLHKIGRHGSRPAHIHFFVSAPDHRHLTTQINLAGDPLLHDDFAYATRDGLIVEAVTRDKPLDASAPAMASPCAEMMFDFVLVPSRDKVVARLSSRARVSA